MLLQRGASVNLQDSLGDTALMGAAFKGHPTIVHVLLDAKADTSLKDITGSTALMAAEQEKNTAEVRDERETAPKADELKTAVALLRKLLEPDADKRLAHFKFAKSCMASVLAEPFFQAESYDKNLSPITGIPNKAAYDLELSKAPQGRLRCVYSIDMANLKVLNDGSSHDEADVVLDRKSVV